MLVTLVGWIISRSPILPMGSAPRAAEAQQHQRLVAGEGQLEGAEDLVHAGLHDLLGPHDRGGRGHDRAAVPALLPLPAGLGDRVDGQRPTVGHAPSRIPFGWHDMVGLPSILVRVTNRDEWQQAFERSPHARGPGPRPCRVCPSSRSTDPTTANFPDSSPTPAAPTPRCTARSCGRCGCSPGSGRAEDTNVRFKEILRSGGDRTVHRVRPAHPDGPGLRRPAAARARWARRAWRWTPWPTSRTCSPTSTWARSPRR